MISDSAWNLWALQYFNIESRFVIIEPNAHTHTANGERKKSPIISSPARPSTGSVFGDFSSFVVTETDYYCWAC